MQFLKRKVKKDFREYFKINPPRSNKIYISCYLGRSQWNYFSWNMHQNYLDGTSTKNFYGELQHLVLKIFLGLKFGEAYASVLHLFFPLCIYLIHNLE